MTWGIMMLVLLGASLHAIWNVQVKAGEDRLRRTIAVAIGAGVVTVPALIVLPFPARECAFLLGVSVFIHLLYFLLLALSYQNSELSVVYPLMRGSAPALTALAALVLVNETPSMPAWVGVFAITVGACALVGGAGGASLWRSPSILLALLNALVIVCYTMVDGMGARLSGYPLSYTAWMIFFTAILILLSFVVVERRRAWQSLAGQLPTAIFGGACLYTSYGLALWAMTKAPIALVGALRETSIVFGLILAGVVLKEPITLKRSFSIALITAGAVFLKVG